LDGGATGQLVEVKFMPRTAARKDYTLFVVCDSWIGADRIVPLKLKASSGGSYCWTHADIEDTQGPALLSPPVNGC
jgi:hypothetical protein